MPNPSTAQSPRARPGGRGAAKPRKEAAEYGTRALESTREQLAIHQTVVDDAADRLRAIEHERSHLTADYTQRVERLQNELASSSQALMQTKMTIQIKTEELATATDRARALVEECVMIKQNQLTEAASIMRAQQDYAIREQELDNTISERSKEVGVLEEALQNERGEARVLKRLLVEKMGYLTKLRAPKAVALSPERGAAGAESREERFFFRLELADLLAPFTAESSSSQFVQLQKTFEIEMERLRQTFVFYCFVGEVNAEDPFTMNTEQFKQLLTDTSITMDSVSLTKCFLNLPIAQQSATPNLNGDADSGFIDLDTFVEVIVRVAFRVYDPTVKSTSRRLMSSGKAAKEEHDLQQKKSSDLVSNLDQLLKSNFKLAKKMKPDKVFLEAYNSIEGHAALKPHNAKLKELFARTRDHFTEEADTAADCEVAPPQADAKEARMSNWQWRMFCEWQGIVGADKLSMNAVMLAFVQVYERRFGRSRADDEALDLPSALAVARGQAKKTARAAPFLSLHAFEDCVATLAWAHAKQLGPKGMTLVDKFKGFTALLNVHRPLPQSRASTAR